MGTDQLYILADVFKSNCVERVKILLKSKAVYYSDSCSSEHKNVTFFFAGM